MAIRTIRAPGVEITEIDKSQYTPSMVGTTVLVAGFASKGESYEPTTITSKASFINYFGEPTNEAERYFYAACNEVLAQNGTLIACKLPYDNISTDQFRFVSYNVNGRGIVSRNSTKALIDAYTDDFKYPGHFDDTACEILNGTGITANEDFMKELIEYVLQYGNLTSEQKQLIISATTLDDTFLKVLKALDVKPVPVVDIGNTAGIECLTVPTSTTITTFSEYFPGDISGFVSPIEFNSDGTRDIVNEIKGKYLQNDYVISANNTKPDSDTGEIAGHPIVAVRVDRTADNAKAYVENVYFNTLSSNISAIYSLRELSKLKNLTLPESVEYIGSKAFKDDISLKYVSFGSNTKYIGSKVFDNAAKNTVTLALQDKCLDGSLSVEANTFNHIVLDELIDNDGLAQGKVSNIEIYLNRLSVPATSTDLYNTAKNNFYINVRNISDVDEGSVEANSFEKINLFSNENSEMVRNVKSITLMAPSVSSVISTQIAISEFDLNKEHDGNIIQSYKDYFNVFSFGNELKEAFAGTVVPAFPDGQYKITEENESEVSDDTLNSIVTSANIVDYCLYDTNFTGCINDSAKNNYGVDFTRLKNWSKNQYFENKLDKDGILAFEDLDNLPEVDGLTLKADAAAEVNSAVNTYFSSLPDDKNKFESILVDLFKSESNIYNGLYNIFTSLDESKFTGTLSPGSSLNIVRDTYFGSFITNSFQKIKTKHTSALGQAWKNPQTPYPRNTSGNPFIIRNNLVEFFICAFAIKRKDTIGTPSLLRTRTIPVYLKGGTPPVDPVDSQIVPGNLTHYLYDIVREILFDMSIDEIISIFDTLVFDILSPANKSTVEEELINLRKSDVAFTSCLSDIDNTIDEYQTISFDGVYDMPLSQLDSYVTGESKPGTDKIIIIDKLGGKYAKTSSSKQECLGIVPVVTTAANAMLVQGLIEPTGSSAERFEAVKDIVVDSGEVVPELAINCSSADLSETTVSKLAARYFPPITFTEIDKFDHENFKKIGIVVLRAYVDSSISNKVNFEVLESFVGSLDEKAVDPATGVSTFIDSIVNNESEYIYVFSNVEPNSKTDIYLASLESAGSLGWRESEMVKEISVGKSINQGLNTIFEKNEDIHEKSIDIVLDAGISNIAQFIQSVYGKKDQTPGKKDDPKGDYDPTGERSSNFRLRTNDDKKTWLSILLKYNEFCSKTRRDCMFIADGLRPICLKGSKKVVRPSKPTNTIDNAILPNLKYLTGINTNYGAGYMDWFEIADDFSGEPFWCPPSIQACGCYIFTDINYNFWDAPAGQKRGNIAALDVAFSPSIRQAGEIYDKSWNYAINYADVGLILEGQKTLQQKASAFDRVNVRRLFLRLERQVYHLCRQFVYEPNNVFTRQCLVDRLDPIFSAVRSAGGIYDYKIICDETINTPEVIDNNELRVKIGIKPTKTAEFILVQFYALKTNGSWDEMDISYSL